MITVLTPTYNRAHTLKRLYNSLVLQSNHDFEWLIIDDGSDDDTLGLVDAFIKDNKVNIKYYFQTNKGKPSAVNFGVSLSNREYILIIDSDDYLLASAIDLIHENIKKISIDEIKFSGLCFRKQFSDGRLVGEEYQKTSNSYVLKNSTELKNEVNCDLAYCFKRSLLVENPFPSFYSEKFVPELYVWNKITDCDKVVCLLDTAIYAGDYLLDGLTSNFKNQLKKNPNGFLLYYKDQFLREDKVLNKIKMLLRILQCTLYKGIK